jgi:hypothetical protein
MPFDDLRARYLDNRLVAFVGAGVSAAGGLPSWTGLIQHVLADARAAATAAEFPALDEAEATLTRGDLIRALGEVQASTTSTIFNRAVSRALDDSRHPVVPTLAQAIASLAPTLHAVVTTNLDRFLERAFSGNWPSFTLPRLDLGQQKHYILQLHGNRIARDSWVLSEREYEDLLHGRPELQRFVEGLFRFHTLLFVGYGLRDPDFDRVCGQLRVFGRGQAPQHFALMPEGKVGNYERHRLADAGIELLTYPNPDGSHAELLRIIKDLAASQPGAAASTSTTSPVAPGTSFTPAPPVAAISTSAVTPREALCGLLQSFFNESELRRFVTFLAGHNDLASRLPGQGASFAALVLETALLLEREGLLAAAFTRLRTERPARAAEVELVQRLNANR